MAAAIEPDVTRPFGSRVLRRKAAKSSILHGVACHSACRLAVEVIHLGSREQIPAISRVDDPVDVGNLGGDAGRRKLRSLRIPVVSQDAVGLIGANKNALAIGSSERTRSGSGERSSGDTLEKGAARSFGHVRSDC